MFAMALAVWRPTCTDTSEEIQYGKINNREEECRAQE